MSDINPNRMIPLHVCDQAVAACEQNIQRLQEQCEFYKSELQKKTEHTENIALQDQVNHLKAEVQRLRHRSEALREAGDELWFCLRHGKRLTHAEVQEAVEDWQSARDAK